MSSARDAQMVLCSIVCDLNPKVKVKYPKVKVYNVFVFVNAYPPKPLDVATYIFVGA